MRRQDDQSYLFSPTDLVNFLGCYHAIFLDLKSFTDPLEADAPSETDLLLRRKGLTHEATYLQALKNQGKTVAEIPTNLPPAERVRRTSEALRTGVDIVYQAALRQGQWGGYADFLIKIGQPSDLGDFRYEVSDTKLARNPDAKHLIQLCVYSDLLASVQGVRPQQTHLILGDGREVSFRVEDFGAYVRHARQRFKTFASNPPTNSYPEPCAHCGYCQWKTTCSAQWDHDDHLSLVANIQHSQLVKLELAGVDTVAALAVLPTATRIPDLNPQVFQRLRSQAALQEHKRRTGQDKAELIDREPGRGFYRLPKSDSADLFFDMEGDPLHPNGLEYLFGLCFHQEGKLAYREFWAHDHGQERATFAQFMEFLYTHLTAHPDAHIYHYAHYEPTALKRLAGRYAVAEHQLDDLLRRLKFVDLYKVVREAIRVSEPAYSLKNLETFYLDKRSGAVATAGDSIVVYNRWRDTGDEQLLRDIASYNEIDCISTAKLRDWLLGLRPQEVTWFPGPPAPADAENAEEKNAHRQEREERYADYQNRIQQAASGVETDYRSRLADLLGFHEREAKPQWWEFFDRQDRFGDELLDDTECLAGLTLTGPPAPVKKSLLHTYRFPPQETKRRAGDKVCDVASLAPAGTIQEIDEDNLIVSIKRGAKNGPLPDNLCIGPTGPIGSEVLRDAIFRFAADVLAGHGRYPVLQALLSKSLPRIHGRRDGEPVVQGEDLLRATTEAVAGLEQSYLFIQGPPGAGKTYTSAQVIVELIRRGEKVGVAANSHKAIHNLLDRIEEIAVGQGVIFQGVKKSSGDDSVYEGQFIHSVESNEDVGLDAQLLAGTAWLFADERFDRHLDYLFIDEAGQVALANVIAMGTAARNIVLVGDQMQLGQPVQGVHPGDAGLSVLDFLLGGQATVSPERGIFLDHTRRLHPTICRFISDAFYDGRLSPDPGNAKRKLIFASPIVGITPEGIHFLPVEHAGCSQKCEEEGRVIKHYYQQLLGQQFREKEGSVRPMTQGDILVVSPYNVQVNHLKSILPAGARVGTVDKFQGQEAPVVLVSMATSSAEDMPRNIEFLFSANRLNVALSRAQCLAAVAASPRLLETPCRSIEQLRLVNKFCQLVEYADRGDTGDTDQVSLQAARR
jgi:predicted RecB family nuclease